MNFFVNTSFSSTIVGLSIIDPSLLQPKAMLNQKVRQSDIACKKGVSEELTVSFCLLHEARTWHLRL
jgi:hypothetical protein